jgi:predicted nicotinamide N-methyase
MASFSLNAFHDAYDTDTIEMVVRARKFYFLTPCTLDRFIDGNDLLINFPLWAKIWEASWVLADHLAARPVDPERSFLEIGGGVGVVSVVAAAFGHRITMTEHNPHALQFARANASINPCPFIRIKEMDWHAPRLEKRYDVIAASEVVYHKRDFAPLQALFDRYLQPRGEIVIAAAMRKITGEFLQGAQKFYNISAKQKVLRSEDESIRLALCRLTRRSID